MNIKIGDTYITKKNEKDDMHIVKVLRKATWDDGYGRGFYQVEYKRKLGGLSKDFLHKNWFLKKA